MPNIADSPFVGGNEELSNYFTLAFKEDAIIEQYRLNIPLIVSGCASDISALNSALSSLDSRVEYVEGAVISVAEALNSLQGDSAIQYETPALQNGWTNLSGHRPFTVFKRWGFISLEGSVENGTSANGTIITRLSIGFRPPFYLTTSARGSVGNIRVDISSNGDVAIYNASPSTWISFNGVRFYV